MLWHCLYNKHLGEIHLKERTKVSYEYMCTIFFLRCYFHLIKSAVVVNYNRASRASPVYSRWGLVCKIMERHTNNCVVLPRGKTAHQNCSNTTQTHIPHAYTGLQKNLKDTSVCKWRDSDKVVCWQNWGEKRCSAASCKWYALALVQMDWYLLRAVKYWNKNYF